MHKVIEMRWETLPILIITAVISTQLRLIAGYGHGAAAPYMEWYKPIESHADTNAFMAQHFKLLVTTNVEVVKAGQAIIGTGNYLLKTCLLRVMLDNRHTLQVNYKSLQDFRASAMHIVKLHPNQLWIHIPAARGPNGAAVDANFVENFFNMRYRPGEFVFGFTYEYSNETEHGYNTGHLTDMLQLFKNNFIQYRVKSLVFDPVLIRDGKKFIQILPKDLAFFIVHYQFRVRDIEREKEIKVREIRYVIEYIGRDNIYLDVSKALRDKLLAEHY